MRKRNHLIISLVKHEASSPRLDVHRCPSSQPSRLRRAQRRREHRQGHPAVLLVSHQHRFPNSTKISSDMLAGTPASWPRRITRTTVSKSRRIACASSRTVTHRSGSRNTGARSSSMISAPLHRKKDRVIRASTGGMGVRFLRLPVWLRGC